MSVRSKLAPALLLAVLLSLLPTVAAQAAASAPTGLTPSATLEEGIPALEWNRVRGATTYNVQVSDTPEFTKVAQKATTTNRRWVPTSTLPAGEVWWRVQAVVGKETSDWSTTSFERDRLAGPTLRLPEDGDTLDQPEDPALLSWDPVSGATGYTVEIDDAADFIGAKAYLTKTASYVVPEPQVATTYYWRVKATLTGGIVTEHSETWTYALGGLEKPLRVGPGNGESVEDIVLEWQPVKGAATYDLQISTNVNFVVGDSQDDKVVEVPRIKGTRYSPPQTLENDEYFWRVRPVDTLGNKLAWQAVDVWNFHRHWPDQPVLEYPTYDEAVGDPFYFQWSPVAKASSYRVQISESSTFPSLSTGCTTVHTTYVPSKKNDCYPGALGTYYWRVLAFDAHGSPSPTEESEHLAAQIGRFHYTPDRVSLGSMTPGDGATVQVPTLRWAPVPHAAQYKVFVTAVDGGSNGINGTTVSGTSFTPRKSLTVGKKYRWAVQPVSRSGRLGPLLVEEHRPVFTVAALDAPTAAVPLQLSPATGAEVHRLPTMTWEPVAGADYYRIGFRPRGNTAAFTMMSDKFAYPAGEDVSVDRLTVESYEWVVAAYDASDTKLSQSAEPHLLHVRDLDAALNPRVAMTGTATEDPVTACTTVKCEGLRQTPVLRWDPVPGAGGYLVYLSRDGKLTNVLDESPYDYPRYVDTNMHVPEVALFDSQAGAAFHWVVLPCKADKACAAPREPEWAFNKLSQPVELLSPQDGAAVVDDVTFEWSDYLATSSQQAEVDGTDTDPRVSAMHYVVEVSTVPNFQSTIDKIEVDQTTYTAFDRTYPEGTLYWRVAAYDGTDNRLTYSEPRTFTKSSPKPVLHSPTDGAESGQTEPFRWESLNFAASYDIEVYKNGDTVGQTANKVLSGTSKQVAFSHTSPLPTSALPYTWRVRRNDADNRDGAWTALTDPAAQFFVRATAPELDQPAAGSVVVGNDALFTWSEVQNDDGQNRPVRATSYRFERRAAGSTSIAEIVTTSASAHAPTRTIADGSWEWRVSTLDAAGKVLQPSPWRSFMVDATRPTVTKASPSGTVRSTTAFTVSFSERVTGVSTATFRVTLKGTAGAVPAKVTLSANGRTATLDPKKKLQPRKTYTVSVTKAVRDKAGNALAAKSWKVKVR